MADETLPLPLEPRPQGKRCKRCRKIKPIAEFHYRPERLRYRAECKDCYRTAMTARRDPEDNRRRVKEWQKANPEKRSAQGKRSYGRLRTDLLRSVSKTLTTTRARSRRLGIECKITGADVAALYHTQNGRCLLTGREMVWGIGAADPLGIHRDAASIDRIDQTKGYSLDNIRLVTFQANFARNRFSDDELFAFCEAVLAARAANAEVC